MGIKIIDEEVIRMPRCNKTECFGNDGVKRCIILTDTTRPDLPCPFFKTGDQYEEDKARAHDRLIMNGRFDLIKKFENNPQRKW